MKTVAEALRQNWVPAPQRKVIYTTDAVEATNRSIRKVIKTKGAFPSEEAARKNIY
jgi:putative transposase